MANDKTILIRDYKAEDFERFKELNTEWIQKRFVLEDVDIEVINNPDKYLLQPGGAILMAFCEGYAVGTCSLKKLSPDVYELTKMTVDERYRGLKIGFLLGKATLEKAKELNAEKVILFSNQAGSSEAIRLYFKLGFTEIPLDTQAYKRADIKMEYPIKTNDGVTDISG